MPCAYPNDNLVTTVTHLAGVPQYGDPGNQVNVGGDAGCSYTYDITFDHEWNHNHPSLPPGGSFSVNYTLFSPTLLVIHTPEYDYTLTDPACDVESTTGSAGSVTVPGDDWFIIGVSSEDPCQLIGSYTLSLTAIDGDPICWSVTGLKKNGRKWQYHGPNRVPDRIKIPSDVNPESCIVIEDGVLVPKHRYKLFN
jgi:hypothetical protein